LHDVPSAWTDFENDAVSEPFYVGGTAVGQQTGGIFGGGGSTNEPLSYTETASAVADGTAAGIRDTLGTGTIYQQMRQALEDAGDGSGPPGVPGAGVAGGVGTAEMGQPSGQLPGMPGSGEGGGPSIGASIGAMRDSASGIAGGVADGMGLEEVGGLGPVETFYITVPIPWVDGTTKEFSLALLPDEEVPEHQMLVDLAYAIRMIVLWLAHLYLGYHLVNLVGKVT
jgi:hypothetical protein